VDPPAKEAAKDSESVPFASTKADSDHKSQTVKASPTSSVASSSTTSLGASNPGVAAALLAAPSYDYQPKEGEVPFSLSVQYFPEDIDETKEITLSGVYAKMTVLQLKLLIYSQGAIKDFTQRISNFHPVNCVRLIYNTQPMVDENTLNDYGIESSGSSVSFIATSG